MGTQRAITHTKHIEFERWAPPLVDADWHALCQAIYKEIEGKNGKSCTIITESGTKRSEPESRVRVNKRKALWAMKAARGRGEECFDPARKEDILGRTKNRLELWEYNLKDPVAALAKALCLETVY